MNINKYNYQEFLLSYVDGELSDNEAKKVELFIASNDFAKEELNILQSTKLQPTNESFGNLQSLYKQSNNDINTSNYEEKFILYVDDELNSIEKKQVETFVLQHPNLQNDFTAFKQSKLQAPLIQHPNKKELYKTVNIKWTNWARLAVAAVFIGFAAMLWINFNKKTEPTIVKNNNNIKDNSIEHVNTSSTQQVDNTTTDVATNSINKNAVKQTKNSSVNILKSSNEEIEKNNKSIAATQQVSIKKSVEHIEKNNSQLVVINKENNTVVTTTISETKNTTPIINNADNINKSVATSIITTKSEVEVTKNTLSQHANTVTNEKISIASFTTVENTNNTTVATKKRKGVLGLFKKAISIINSEGNDDEDYSKTITLTVK